MKKNKSKSKVEERKSVVNTCDYSRMNGKCGRALCEHFGKECAGRSCEDWTCDAEGETAKWFCGELRCDGTCGNGKSENHNKKCRGENCPDLIPTNSTAVAVVEPKAGTLAMSDQDVAAGITRQLQVIEDADRNAQFERAKLGVVLIRWEQYLGVSRGGRGKAGEGLKGWLEEHVPQLNYKTAVNYKTQAEMAVKMLGGGAKAQAVLLDEPTVTQPDGEVIDIEPEFVAKRDKIFEDVKSRRQLEQTYFKFMAHEGKGRQGGANKGQSGTGRRALTAVEKAEDAEKRIREIVGSLVAFDQGSNFMKIDHTTQSDIILALKDIVKSFEEQAG